MFFNASNNFPQILGVESYDTVADETDVLVFDGANAGRNRGPVGKSMGNNTT
jgi:hypothetical protein